MKVHGVIKVDFPDKKDPAKRVRGVTVWLAEPIPADIGEGFYRFEKIFLTDWAIQHGMTVPQYGDEVELIYKPGRNGKAVVSQLRVIAPAK